MGPGLINLRRVHEQLGVGAMADPEPNSSRSSAGETNSGAVENSVWDEWAHDEASTSGFFPELVTATTTPRLAFPPTDMLSSWMSTFHPTVDTDLFPLDHPHVPICSVPTYPSPLPAVSGTKPSAVSLQSLDPQSPSSPLAIQNGVLNPLGDPWDGASRSCCSWPSSAPSRPRHTDIFIGPNGTFEATPGGWTPQFYDGTATKTIKPVKRMAQTFGDPTAWLGKHRLELELSLDGDDHPGGLQLKRSKPSVGSGLKWGDDLRTYNGPSAVDMIAIGPALNTNGKPRARRGSATDPQSVYARQRRERINDRLKTLQHLVPNGAKVDIVTMLDEAYDYVKFLQYQVTLLKSDEFWMHATPYSYNGMDISILPAKQTQELESSA